MLSAMAVDANGDEVLCDVAPLSTAIGLVMDL